MHPAKAVGENEIPFSRDTCAIPSNIVLDASHGPPREGEIWVAAMSPIAKLLWPFISGGFRGEAEGVPMARKMGPLGPLE